MMELEAGYQQARKLLHDRFGNDYKISEPWVKKLIDGPRIMPADERAIQKLADDLTSCMLALTAMGKLEEVNTRWSLGLIVKRLPQYLQTKWRSKAVQILERTGQYPNILRLV